jgi:RNA polymerase sigma-32 factor
MTIYLMAKEQKTKTSKSHQPSPFTGKKKQPVEKSTSVSKPAPRSKKTTALTTIPQDPLLQTYLKEIQKYPILSKEEEHELAVQFKNSQDRETLQKLVTANLRFVVKIAYEYIHYRVKLLDLIQEGNMGLVKAVQEFDPYKDVRLTTYAVWWIRSYIQDAILKNYSLVKMGTTQAQKRLFYRLRKEQKKLEQEGISPSQGVKLLAQKLDVKEKEIEEMSQRLNQNDVSLNAPVSHEEKSERINHLASSQAPADVTLGEAEQETLFKKILKQFGETLEGREKVVFYDRLVSEDPLTLQEIGEKYKFTKERARQIEEQVKEKLKKYMQEHYPDFDLLANS